MKKPYLTYALSAEGKLVHIDSVANGKELWMFLHLLWRASSGETRCKAQAPFFSHLSGTECKPAYESMLHLWLKRKYRKHSIIEHHYI